MMSWGVDRVGDHLQGRRGASSYPPPSMSPGAGPHRRIASAARTASSGGAARACGLVALIALLMLPNGVWAHAFVNRSDPRAGASLNESAAQVRIWFDGPIEPMYVDLRVENGDTRRVDKGDARVSPGDNTLIEVGLPPLPPGRYRVFWSVIARDGHRREGNFSFLVK